MRFAVQDAAPVADDRGLLGMQFDKPDLLHLAQTALFGGIGVLALLLVLRPMVLRITSVGAAGAVAAAVCWPRSPAPWVPHCRGHRHRPWRRVRHRRCSRTRAW